MAQTQPHCIRAVHNLFRQLETIAVCHPGPPGEHSVAPRATLTVREALRTVKKLLPPGCQRSLITIESARSRTNTSFSAPDKLSTSSGQPKHRDFSLPGQACLGRLTDGLKRSRLQLTGCQRLLTLRLLALYRSFMFSSPRPA